MDTIVLGVSKGWFGRYKCHHSEVGEYSFGQLVDILETNPDARCFKNTAKALGHSEKLAKQGTNAVQICGMWLELCVTMAIAHSIEAGLVVRVPKNRVHSTYTARENCDLRKEVNDRAEVCFRYAEDQENYYFGPWAVT